MYLKVEKGQGRFLPLNTSKIPIDCVQYIKWSKTGIYYNKRGEPPLIVRPRVLWILSDILTESISAFPLKCVHEKNRVALLSSKKSGFVCGTEYLEHI